MKLAFLSLLFCGSLVQAAPLNCELPRNYAPTDAVGTLNVNDKITRLYVNKSARRLYVFAGTQVLKIYHVSLGFTPVGKKTRVGDGKTPEGTYYLTSFNPGSSYTKSYHISYPDWSDIKNAQDHGFEPGGDIMLHGFPRPDVADNLDPDRILLTRARATHNTTADWTAGCIGVTNDEIYEIAEKINYDYPNIMSAPGGKGLQIDLCP
jgi:murein L,D-transpeptidase YafK